jgi:hypothetical protein
MGKELGHEIRETFTSRCGGVPEKISLSPVAAKASSEGSGNNNHCLPLPFMEQMKAG